jgi:hypothetical protein
VSFDFINSGILQDKKNLAENIKSQFYDKYNEFDSLKDIIEIIKGFIEEQSLDKFATNFSNKFPNLDFAVKEKKYNLLLNAIYLVKDNINLKECGGILQYGKEMIEAGEVLGLIIFQKSSDMLKYVKAICNNLKRLRNLKGFRLIIFLHEYNDDESFMRVINMVETNIIIITEYLYDQNVLQCFYLQSIYNTLSNIKERIDNMENNYKK